MLIQTNDDWQQNVHIMPLTQLFNQRRNWWQLGPQMETIWKNRVVVGGS